MTVPKFTPGPWRADISADEWSAGHFEIAAGEGKARVVLATRMPWSSRAEESAANGYLMAAAPDLYDALSSWVKGLSICGTCGAGRPTSATSDGVEAARQTGAHHCVECVNWVRSNAALRKARGES